MYNSKGNNIFIYFLYYSLEIKSRIYFIFFKCLNVSYILLRIVYAYCKVFIVIRYFYGQVKR